MAGGREGEEEAVERPSGDRRKSQAGRRRQGGEGVACEGGWGWRRLVGVGLGGDGGVSTSQDAPAQLLCF